VNARFELQPELLAAWRTAVPALAVTGLAGARRSGRAAVVAVLDARQPPPSAADLTAAGAALAAVLAVPSVELVTVAGADLAAVVRQWVHQAAQGSGRGVAVAVREHRAGVGVVVTAVDSSARELAMRLASAHEPALPALSALLGRPVTVDDGGTEVSSQ
jgi:hypothetical protein